MSGKRWILILGLVPLLSCGQQNTDLDAEVEKLYRNTIPTVSFREAQNWNSAVFLDAREIEEFEVSHIPSSKFVGYDDFDLASVNTISREDTIIVYCSIGYRSERIGEKLRNQGFRYVYNLYGGIFHWKNSNGILVTNSNDTTDLVHTYNQKWGRFLKNGKKVY